MSNTAGIQTAGSPLAVASPLVGVSATSAGIIAPPSGYVTTQVIISNISPWAMSITDLQGTRYILPYTTDVGYPPAQGVPFAMSVPPGGSSTAPPGALACYQASWYVAGGGPPPGTYPVSLTAQAVATAVLSAVFLETTTSSEDNQVDIPADGGTHPFILAPPAGMVKSLGTFSIATNLENLAQITFTGNPSGHVYLSTDVPSLAEVVAPMIFPLDITVTEDVEIVVTNAGGNLTVCTSYRLLPAPS